MTLINNLSGVTAQAEQPSDVEKCTDDCKTKFNQILPERERSGSTSDGSRDIQKSDGTRTSSAETFFCQP